MNVEISGKLHEPPRDADNVLDVREVQISIIVPALNEAANLTPLAERVGAALRGRAYELIIVDDNSTDDTPAVAASLAERLPVRLIVRTDAKDGLSGAVLRGVAESRGDVLVVMDADLQHPPEKLPELIAPLERNEAEFVLGSRYVPGGSIAEGWNAFRALNSSIATILARPFAGKITDPMSGFFALRRSTYERAQRLTPLGYKIALELICKSRVANVHEVPIHFALRERGQSKLTIRQQFRYLEHLSRLYDFTYPRASPVIKFLIVLALSWLVAGGLFVMLIEANLPTALATVLAYLEAIIVTAIFHARYVRTQRQFIIRPRPWWDFFIISEFELLACLIAVLWVKMRFNHPSLAEVFFIPFGIATGVRYILRKEFLQDVRGLRKEIRPE
jgi:dolichol-phosphate mannosyltransferase